LEENQGKPLTPSEVEQYKLDFPNAGVKIGDTRGTADAKAQGLNQPRDYSDAELTSFANQAKTGKVSYENAIAEIDNDVTVNNKDEAKQIYAQVYGKKVKQIEKPVFGTGNFKNVSINDRISQIKNILGTLATESYIQEDLIKSGYPQKAVYDNTASVGTKLLDSVSSFLFKK